MKKMKFILTSSLGLLLLAISSPAYAATSDTSDATITFEQGVLNIASVPTLNFGTHTTSSQTVFQPTATPDNVIVEDFRGTGDGWNLTAQLSQFKLQPSDTTATLNGAKITMDSPTPTTTSGNTSNAPEVDSQIELISGGASARVMTAGATVPTYTGAGQWEIDWNTSNTELEVNAGNIQDGTSKAVITWTLEVTP